MRLPRSLRIGPHRYRVSSNAATSLLPEHHTDHETAAPDCKFDERPRKYVILGLFDSARHLIYVSRRQDEQAKREVILHEAIHALFEMAGFHDHGALSRYEERVVTTMTNQLLDLLRDNPALVRFLLEDD